MCHANPLDARARAYRRPVTAGDVQTLMEFFESARAAGNFDDGIRAALERVLVSPDFLFRIETDPAGVPRGTAYRISDVELASRLSYFLWSSGPTTSCSISPSRGSCGSPACSSKQVRRLLSAPRARAALVNNFFGQWLQSRNVWLLTPDANTRFPGSTTTCAARSSARRISSWMTSSKADRSIVDLLSADYTFLNQQLAGHYGIRGVYGSHFRRVSWPTRTAGACSARRACWP
jgi:hypothetical protein